MLRVGKFIRFLARQELSGAELSWGRTSSMAKSDVSISELGRHTMGSFAAVAALSGW